MKYMGSKRYMLGNGLGDMLRDQLPRSKRFVDLFAGSGGVVNYVAMVQHYDKPIIANDLQLYSAILSKAVIGRTKVFDVDHFRKVWIEKATKNVQSSRLFSTALSIDEGSFSSIQKKVTAARKVCGKPSRIGPVWNAYGGHYYSPIQALSIDYLIKTLPEKGLDRDVCLAALIIAASRTAAAPGHTAQPFQPTEGAGKFIEASWKIDIFKSCMSALQEISPLHANVPGKVYQDDAMAVISKLREGDLVFLDPPYSGVQYSRFYHVLETIARGKCGKVSGVGRYPDLSQRPQSKFSNAGQSLKALDELLFGLSKKRVSVIFTFPKGKCSNGLSGDAVIETAKKYFTLDEKQSKLHTHAITGSFSTLGGNNKLNKHKREKKSRVKSEELVLLLKPRQNK
ncbi:MAG: adenine methyltransferase [Candidatus Moranbacteria bacterium]|nr:adenine methyltransferase [Candidatus Moranbacteria bacterium]